MQGNRETNGRPQRVAATDPLKTRDWCSQEKYKAFQFKLLGNSSMCLDYFQQNKYSLW